MQTVAIGNSIFGNEGWAALAIAVVAVFFLMLSLRRKQQRGAYQDDRESALREPPKSGSNTSKQKMQRDLEDLIVELQQLSRQIGAEIDTRFAKLEAAMRDADRRIAALNRLSRQGDATEGKDEAPAESHEARHAVIYELADAGFTPVEIAKDLGRTPGEIELVLNLRRGSQS